MSGTVQIVAAVCSLIIAMFTAFCTLATTTILAIFAFLTHRANQKRLSQAEDAAFKVEQLKLATQELVLKNEQFRIINDQKIDGLIVLSKDTHTLVNSAMGAQLKEKIELYERIVSDGHNAKPEDIKSLELSKKRYADHMSKQGIVDRNI
jgi:hypothetical protein